MLRENREGARGPSELHSASMPYRCAALMVRASYAYGFVAGGGGAEAGAVAGGGAGGPNG